MQKDDPRRQGVPYLMDDVLNSVISNQNKVQYNQLINLLDPGSGAVTICIKGFRTGKYKVHGQIVSSTHDTIYDLNCNDIYN